jgi:hypothetical protein
MHDICQFLNENPTETVLSIVKPGHHLAHWNNANSRAARVENDEMPDAIRFIDSAFEKYGGTAKLRKDKTIGKTVTMGELRG